MIISVCAVYGNLTTLAFYAMYATSIELCSKERPGKKLGETNVHFHGPTVVNV